MPMPALNIMAIQDRVEKSGFSPCWDSGMLPYRPKARTREKATKPVAARMNSQPRFVVTQLSAADAPSPMAVVKIPPKMHRAAMMPKETPNTVLSTVAHPALADVISSSSSGGALTTDSFDCVLIKILATCVGGILGGDRRPRRRSSFVCVIVQSV